MIKRTLLANAIRILSIDAVQRANSGHPGAPMGMADIAEVLWRDYINHNPTNPLWSNRDRFVLSNGHGSMLLYSILHLTGYNLPIEELKNFRQIDSKTPGHPEYKITEGVEATTGPLGQGLANAVGMAIAERTLASQFNKPNLNIVDHYTYVFLGDGCLMEGISHEACSLAGTMQLNKLIAFYDNNGISIDGNIKDYFTDDTISRFTSYKWNVIKNINGHNSSEIKNAIEEARSIKNKPSIIICDTIIAFGSPNKEGSNEAHGSPLGKEEISATRKKLNWHEQEFIIPKEIYKYWDAKEKGKIKEDLWNKTFELYEQHYPKLAQEFKRRINNVLPNKWEKTIQKIIENTQISKENISTRAASQNILENIGPILPEFLGGSADLTPSNLTTYSKSISILKNKTGNYIHYGVREFGMTAIANGIALYGGFIPYSATFLTFMDYARNAVRMAAMMKIKHIMIYTHDSIGLGEDGPTHQPIEQISSLRAIPNISLWRPCDQIETAVAWKAAIENNDGPTVLILSRQNLQKQTRNAQQLNNINRGGYILKDSKKTPELIFISTGSEVNLAVNAYDRLTQEGYNVRVISLPSTDIFEKQNNHYRDYVLPKQITKRIAIEAGAADYWYKYVGLDGKIIGMTTFGASGPTDKVFKKFGFDANNITNIARNMMKYTNIAE